MFGTHRKFWVIVFAFAVSALFISWAICQEQNESAPSEENKTALEWIWGEVVSVDSQNNQITLKYMDEESLEEKEFTLNADKDTIYEGAQALLDIKPADSVSADYVVTQDGLNLAKNITVERAQATDMSLPEDVLSNTQATYPEK